MPRLRHPYKGESTSRQSPPYARAAAVAALALSLGGCAGLGLPFGGEMTASTASASGGLRPTLVKASVIDGVDSSDWETVRRTIARVGGEAAPGRVEWNNPDTGSTGTIADIKPAAKRGEILCRGFSTTVTDVHGVRRFLGDACQRTDGRWQLYGMVPDDATFL